jgi:hypothetical protein
MLLKVTLPSAGYCTIRKSQTKTKNENVVPFLSFSSHYLVTTIWLMFNYEIEIGVFLALLDDHVLLGTEAGLLAEDCLHVGVAGVDISDRCENRLTRLDDALLRVPPILKCEK